MKPISIPQGADEGEVICPTCAFLIAMMGCWREDGSERLDVEVQDWPTGARTLLVFSRRGERIEVAREHASRADADEYADAIREGFAPLAT